MISFKEFLSAGINEGLLDWDDKELDLRGSRAAINTEISSKSGEIWKYIRYVAPSTHITDDGTLQCEGDAFLSGKGTNGVMSDLLADGIINSLASDGLSIWNFPVVSPKDVPGDIYCSHFGTRMCDVLKDLNIYIDDNRRGSMMSINRYNYANFHNEKSNEGVSFKNVNIDFNNIPQPTMCFHCDAFVDLNSLKSNVQKFCQHTSGDLPEEYMKLFKPGKCSVYKISDKMEWPRPIKNIKQAVALVSDSKNYKFLSHILKLTPRAKVSDLYPTNVLKDLDEIVVKNNDVALVFIKEGAKETIAITETRSISDWKTQAHVNDADIVRQCQKTADGWYVIWKRRNGWRYCDI